MFLPGALPHAESVEGSAGCGGGGGIGAMWERLAGGPVKLGTMHESTGRHFFFCSVKKDVVDIGDVVVVVDIHVVLDAGPIPPPLTPQSQSSERRACDRGVYAAYSNRSVKAPCLCSAALSLACLLRTQTKTSPQPPVVSKLLSKLRTFFSRTGPASVGIQHSPPTAEA